MVASNVGFDSEMHDPKSFRYLDLSKGNSASGSSFRQTICGSGIRRDTKVCGGNTGMDKKSRGGTPDESGHAGVKYFK